MLIIQKDGPVYVVLSHYLNCLLLLLFNIFLRSFQQIVLLEKKKNNNKDENEKIIPESVNYHFTRQCNYSCGFCFHTAKTSFVLPLEEAKRGLKLLVDAGMKKVNFSGINLIYY